MQQLTGQVRRCIDEYNMIDQNETIALGVSGGKDSLALLYTLADLCKYHPKNFNIHAVTMDMGFSKMDFTPVAKLCDELNIPYTLKQTDIARIVFDVRKEKNPCSLCAKMRRAALCNLITELGVKKIALAHHYDDAVETFLLSLIYEGRLHCFQPVTYLDKTGVTQIRPMLYVEEKTIKKLVLTKKLPIVHNTCPMNGISKREKIKALIKTLGITEPKIKTRIFGAIKRLPLEGW